MLKCCQPSRCRGAAMFETTLALPIILFVMVMMFFIGTAFSRLNRASVMDRYEAWRRISDAPGPFAWNTGVEMQLRDDEMVYSGYVLSGDQMNQTFFGSNASGLEGRLRDTFPSEPRELHITVVGNLWPDAGQLVQTVSHDLPSGKEVRFITQHENTVPMLESFEGPIEHRFVVFGHEWKFTNRVMFNEELDKWSYTASPATSHMRSVRDQFFTNFDSRIGALADAGNGLADLIQSFYYTEPPYRGPDMPPNWWVNASPNP